MSIPVTCPSCKASFKVKDKCAGQRGRCPKCRGMIDVPAAAPDEGLDTSWLDGIEDDPPSDVRPAAPSKPAAPKPAASKPKPTAAPRPAATKPAAARPTAAQSDEKIEFPCPHCGTRFRVAAAYAGQTTKCHDCGGSLTIPAPSATVADDPMTAEIVADPLVSAPLGASGDGFDDLLGDAPLSAPSNEGNPFGPLPGKKSKPKKKKASASFDGVAWPDLVAGGVLVFGLLMWLVGDWGLAANLVSFGCFLVLLIQMFSHGRVGVAVVSFVLCCGVGQLIAAQQGFANPEWRSQKVASLLLVAYLLNVIYFVTVLPDRRAEWERAWAEVEQAQDQHESNFGQQPPMPFPGFGAREDEPIPTVTLSNVECYQAPGDSVFYFHGEYQIDGHSRLQALNYWFVTDLGPTGTKSIFEAFEPTGSFTHGIREHEPHRGPVQVWIELENRSAGFHSDRVSDVVRCSIRSTEPAWLTGDLSGETSGSEQERPSRPDAGQHQHARSTPKPQEPPQDPIDAALKELAEGNEFARRKALSQIMQQQIDEARRDEVVAALGAALESIDDRTRREAVKAMGVWGTADSVPTLIEMLTDTDNGVRKEAATALAKMGDQRAVEPIAELLDDFFTRGEAAKALRSMGTAAEEELATFLAHPSHDVRKEVCKILADIGTMKSVPELFKLENDPDRGVYREADQAIRKIRFRYERDNPEAAADEKKPREPIRFTPNRRGR